MSASRQAYWWERLLHLVPGVTVWCPGYNRHFRWNNICFCVRTQDWGVLLHYRGNLWLSLTGPAAGILLKGHKPS